MITNLIELIKKRSGLFKATSEEETIRGFTNSFFMSHNMIVDNNQEKKSNLIKISCKRWKMRKFHASKKKNRLSICYTISKSNLE